MKTKLNGILTLLLAFVVQLSFAQAKTFSGNVSDETGPLPGVSILIKGTTTGTETDFDGNYSLQANTGDTLVYSFVGMETQEITVGSSNLINVTLIANNILQEVVVTAYGTQTKESLTGSITQINSEEFSKVASGNAITGLTGKVAGVQIFANSGQPGAAPIVRFRGIGSLNGSSNPLYVVDGVPYTESITNINPNDIESMSFVKDASAAALYGSRGANGVIIITTKKGKAGKLNISLDIKSSISDRAIKDYNVITGSGDYFEAYHRMLKTNEMVLNGLSETDAGIKASNDLIDGVLGLVYNPYGGDRNTLVDPASGNFRGGTPVWEDNWRDYLFNGNGDIQSAYLSVAGGTDKSKFFFSLGHENNTGFNINTGFKRTTISTNIETQFNKHFKVGASLGYTNREQKGTLTNNITGNFAWVRNIAPIYPVFARDHNTGEVVTDSRGNRLWDWADVTSPNASGGRPYNGFSNPHALQTLNVNTDVRDNISGKAFGTYTFLTDFNFTYKLGYDLATYNTTDYTNKVVGSASSTDINGRITERFGRGTTFTNQQLLNWTKSFDGVHNFDVLVGHESSQYNFKNLNASLRNQFLADDLSVSLFAVPDGNEAIVGNFREYNLEGYFSRVMYNYNNKYYFNGSFRRDGSSVFSEDNRWGNFYGLGGAWRVSNEDFMANVSWISELKLKSSFGQQGNDVVYYPGTVTRNYAPYLDQWGITKNGTSFDIAKTVFGNEDLTWETSNNFNAGFELSMFDHRLSIEAEYFVRKITDLIHNRELPSSTGFPSVPENVMDMENVGVEILASYQIIQKEDLSLSFSVNATSYENKITKMVPNKEFLDSGRYRWTVGGSAYDYYMREYVGINQTNGNAMWRTDIVNDPVTGDPTNGVTESYSVATQYILGETALPTVYGGFSTNLVYKNFDFGIDFSYQLGGFAYDEVYNDGFDGRIGANFSKDYTKTWGWNNTTATLPRIDNNTNNWNQFSDFYIIKSDYLSLNNISLGYSLPKDVTEKLGLSKLRLYGNANNIGLWSKGNQGFDPRQRVAGNNNAVRYAALKTYTLGLTINL